MRFSRCSELQPDFMVLRLRDDYRKKGHPTPADVLLLIEVSDTTLRFDRGAKADPCARRSTVPFGPMPLPGSTMSVDLTGLLQGCR